MIELLVCPRPMGHWSRGDVLHIKPQGQYIEPTWFKQVGAIAEQGDRTKAERERILREGADTNWGAMELREFAVITTDADPADVRILLAMNEKGERTHFLHFDILLSDQRLQDIANKDVLVKPDRKAPVPKAALVAAIRKKG